MLGFGFCPQQRSSDVGLAMNRIETLRSTMRMLAKRNLVLVHVNSAENINELVQASIKMNTVKIRRFDKTNKWQKIVNSFSSFGTF